MIIGEHTRDNDLEVNPLKAKQLTNIRTTSKDEAIRLTPPRAMSLEQAIAYIEGRGAGRGHAEEYPAAQAPARSERAQARKPFGRSELGTKRHRTLEPSPPFRGERAGRGGFFRQIPT